MGPRMRWQRVQSAVSFAELDDDLASDFADVLASWHAANVAAQKAAFRAESDDNLARNFAAEVLAMLIENGISTCTRNWKPLLKD